MGLLFEQDERLNTATLSSKESEIVFMVLSFSFWGMRRPANMLPEVVVAVAGCESCDASSLPTKASESEIWLGRDGSQTPLALREGRARYVQVTSVFVAC